MEEPSRHVQPQTTISGVVCVVFDCAEPRAQAEWWRRLLGGEVVLDGDGDASLHLPGSPRLDFLRVPEAKTVKNRVHIEVVAVDFDAAVQHASATGATRARDLFDGSAFAVFRDPEGNEFCLLRPGWDAHRAVGSAGGDSG
jgi:catechol 2,3-dioxygenase-like lactoylglutathione lyase family enzyme